MSHHPGDPPGDLLVHCSTDRTLVRATDPHTGRMELIKVFARGSLADAERECDLGRRLGDLDVVRYLGAGLDADTNRPCVRMELHQGQDLEALVGERGALHPAEACGLLAHAAATLAAMHATRTADLPRGLAHGDLRPANLLCHDGRARILDLEHARPADLAAVAADMVALAATLRFALIGGHGERRSLQGHDPAVVALIEACAAATPGRGPSAAEAAERLQHAAARLRDDPAAAALDCLQRGDAAAATALLQQLPADRPRHDLDELVRRRNRLLRRRPGLATFDPIAADSPPRRLLATLRQSAAVLDRFPAHPDALAARRAARAAAGHALAQVPGQVGELRRGAAFDDAADLLRDSLRLTEVALAVPGTLRIDGNGDPRMPSSLQVRPHQVLAHLAEEVDQARQDHDAVMAELAAAEGELDLAAAEAVVERIAAARGGATAVVAQCRDRLHRLAYYLDRLARSRPNVARLGELLASAERPVDLTVLQQLLDRCGGRKLTGSRSGEVQSGLGLRGVTRALQDLGAEFAALSAQTQPCQTILESALAAATQHAWDLLADAQAKLTAEPVPVRPLQTLLHRLDALRMLEALTDLPQRPRSLVLDRIESLRMAIDQARATRDRLARGAELAMARGHWTTGLFDMERAVGRLADEDDDDASADARRLQERLAEARRRKQDIEAAVRRNMELARVYADLLDDPQSSFEQRLQVLHERRDLLHFLAPLVQADRGELYGSDLRDVEAQMAQEQATHAETLLDHTDDPHQRLELARQTLGLLAGPAVSGAHGAEPPGRILRLLEHWRRLCENAEREVARAREEADRRQRRQRRQRLLAAAATVVVLLGGALATGVFSGRAALADQAQRVALQLGPTPTARDVARNEVEAVLALTEAARQLEPRLLAAAEPLLAAVRSSVGGTRNPDIAALQQELHAAVSGFGTALVQAGSGPVSSGARGAAPPAAAAALQGFAARAWFVGLCALLARTEAAGRAQILARAQQDATALSALGIALPPQQLQELRDFR